LSFLAQQFIPVKKPFLFILIVSICGALHAQKILPGNLKDLVKREDSLQQLAKNLIIDSLTAGRMRNDSLFVRTLVRALQIKNSFYYPFDSVQGISKLYAPDSTFRIFSWSLSYDDFYSRQRAAIQFKTPDGSLKLVPLRDFSEFTDKPTDSIRSKDTWIGAVYYNIIKTQHGGKNYYTLFGFDDNNVRSNKKWIDVLSFDGRNMPVFGNTFSFEKDSVKRPPLKRYYIEYKKEASALVNYDPDLKMILVDHLISETEETDKPYTFVPDGDYEGFEWKNGTWVHIDKVFDQKLEDGQAPVPEPLLDDRGNPNQEKLEERSNRNRNTKTGR
jgi:hypothetical protein